MPRRPLAFAAILSVAILVARLGFPAAALSDPAGNALPPGIQLSFPLLNILFAPLFDAWDGVTLLAMPRLHAFLTGVGVLYLVWRTLGGIFSDQFQWGREVWALAAFVLGTSLFLVAGVRWHRPMAHLADVPPTLVVVDLHSHSNVSHDVRGILQKDFDVAADQAWHRRGGFDLFFVTDHNRIDGWQRTKGGEGLGGMADEGPPVACPGEELSLWRAHIVVLGNLDSVPRDIYADSMPGILRLLGESESRWGAVTLASIPEYDENHFASLPSWIVAGVDGFEISNAAPKANRQTTAHRDSVVRLAAMNGRWVAGVTDQHGMGATVQSWTLVPRTTAGTHDRAMPALCQDVLHVLATRGHSATQVIERHRLRIDSAWPTWATVVGVAWEGWRAAGWAQVASWLVWIWVLALAALSPRGQGRSF